MFLFAASMNIKVTAAGTILSSLFDDDDGGLWLPQRDINQAVLQVFLSQKDKKTKRQKDKMTKRQKDKKYKKTKRQTKKKTKRQKDKKT